MLRANLYKKFSKSNLPKAVDGVEQSNPSFEPMSLDRMMYPSEEINSKGLSVTPTKQPDLRSINLTGTAPLPSFGVKSSFFEGMSTPEMAVRGADPGTRKVQTPQGEVYVQPGYVHSSEVNKTTKTKKPVDYNSLFTLGLGVANMGLGFNEDLRNRRDLQESIQNRNSKPVYDYNYMYGRTTSGGTEYQPTIKAEMGAQITKRQNTPYGANNVEIEGGEFIQLPNFDTEYAEGPSHEQGGIKTSLPEGTRVYSDHLKPEGSKKTFAQLAKKYDTSKFKETLDSPFKKQVDKDTANIMMTRNQKMLDELFAKQQSMNGDSNGEMRDGGIHNPGFMALPQAVQEKILANMEYGGYQLPEYGTGGTPKAKLYTQSNTEQGRTTPTGKSSLAPTKSAEEYLKPWIGTIPNIENMSEGEAQAAIYDYALENNPESVIEMWTTFGNTNKGKEFSDLTKMFPSGKITKESLTPEVLKTMRKAYIDNKLGARTLVPTSSTTPATTTTTPETPKKKEEPTTPVVQPESSKGNTYGIQGTVPKGKYTKDPFNVGSLIPNVYGLAEAQTTYPYAIPEIDAPYLKPQTLNIQSQLQDIDNMGTAAVRSGADPMTAYLAGLDAKQKSFQTKQNYDAEGRSKADMFNAEARMKADVFNAEAFDKNYNERNALAKAYQSQEKSKQLANAVDKYSDWNKTEASKKFLYDNFVTSFDLDRAKSDEMTVTQDAQPFYVGNPIQNIINQAISPATKSTKSTKSTKKGKLGLSVGKKSSLSKYKK